MKSVKLPKKLSTLLSHALEDLQAVERSPRYKIDMSTWHCPSTHPKTKKPVCYVCLGGAMLVKRFKLAPTDAVFSVNLPNSVSIPDNVYRALVALNTARAGCVTAARRRLYDWDTVSKTKDRRIPRYERNPKGFKRGLRKLIKDLKENNE